MTAEEREPIRWGDRVSLSSGGPICLAVDLMDFDRVVIAWPTKAGHVEAILPAACLRRECAP